MQTLVNPALSLHHCISTTNLFPTPVPSLRISKFSKEFILSEVACKITIYIYIYSEDIYAYYIYAYIYGINYAYISSFSY